MRLFFQVLVNFVGCAVDHLARDVRILDYHVAVRETAPLLFLLFWRENKVLCSLEQIVEFIHHQN
jgi:hypothetical protein